MENDDRRNNRRNKGQDDGQQQWGNSTEDEQERFGDQVRNSPQGKKARDRVDPQSGMPTDRSLGIDNHDDPDWNGTWNDQRLSPSSADTDLDSDIERGP